MPNTRSGTHPYALTKDRQLRKIVSKEIDEHVKNGDLAETTPDPYIVGYIGKVGEARKLKAKS